MKNYLFTFLLINCCLLSGCAVVYKNKPDTASENKVVAKTPKIDQVLILRGVRFEGYSVTFVKGYENVLDQVYASLQAYPEVKIEIAGHTSNTLSEEEAIRISSSQANAVMQYLVLKGISQDRLRAVGYGKSRPVTSNATPEGRKLNDRIEIQPEK
jgi:outer membrane protein OmpA-like peptidoglycan-associated protein